MSSNRELVLVTNRPVRSPITINLDSALNLERFIRPLDPVYVHGETIQIGEEASINIADASTYQNSSDPTSRAADLEQIGAALRQASFILRIIETSQSVLDPLGLPHSCVVDFVRDGIIPLRRSNDAIRFREASLKIVGLGLGFTPSGDDMLGGFLATYNSLSRTVERVEILLDFALLHGKTSWISAKLLDYMQRLILDEQVDHMIRSAICGDEEDFILAMETLLPRGHTSGVDISTGTILALSLIRDIALGEEETETVATELGLLR